MKCKICLSERTFIYGSTTCSSFAADKKAGSSRDLYRCRNCGSIMVFPTPSDEQLKEYYEDYADVKLIVNWEKRTSFKIIQNICNKLKKGSILDIGCGDGRLLGMLPSDFRKYGIDVSERACRIASQNGVTALCSALESAEFQEKFDVVLALDFIEHTANPIEAFRAINKLLKPDGYMVIETGNADSYAARLLGEDWSYTSVYGHLCVISPEALSKLASEEGIHEVCLKEGWHILPKLNMYFYRNFLAYGFRFFRFLYRLAEPISSRNSYLSKLYRHAPPGAPNKDHVIFVGEKPNPSDSPFPY